MLVRHAGRRRSHPAGGGGHQRAVQRGGRRRRRIAVVVTVTGFAPATCSLRTCICTSAGPLAASEPQRSIRGGSRFLNRSGAVRAPMLPGKCHVPQGVHPAGRRQPPQDAPLPTQQPSAVSATVATPAAALPRPPQCCPSLCALIFAPAGMH